MELPIQHIPDFIDNDDNVKKIIYFGIGSHFNGNLQDISNYWKDNEIDSSDFFESVNLGIKFSSFSEIKDWFNTEYMKILLEYCHDAFDYVRYL